MQEQRGVEYKTGNSKDQRAESCESLRMLSHKWNWDMGRVRLADIDVLREKDSFE